MARKTRVTPAGVALWPRLTTPDTKFNKDGVYQVKLELAYNDEGVEDLIKYIDGQMDESFALAQKDNPDKKVKAADKPYQDSETEGVVRINFKSKAKGTRSDGTEWEFHPALFDAKGTPIKASQVMIGSGSLIKVSFTPFQFYTAMIGAGVSLRVQAVQILKLEEYGGRAQDHGFGAEDGYDSAEPEKEPWDEGAEAL